MRLSTFLSTAALALTANAFLIPLEVADKAIADGAKTSITTSKQTIKLDCPGCPIALKDGKWKPTKETDSEVHLVMDFAVRDNKLTLNDRPIFPPQNARPVGAKQELTYSEEIADAFTGFVPLSTGMDVQETMIRGRDGFMKIQVISYDVLGLQDQVVRVPTIKIRLAELSNGQVSLVHTASPRALAYILSVRSPTHRTDPILLQPSCRRLHQCHVPCPRHLGRQVRRYPGCCHCQVRFYPQRLHA